MNKLTNNTENKDISVGEKINIKIETLTNGGDGLGRHNKLAIFIPKTVPEDFIEAEITAIKKNYALAKVIRTIKESEFRQIEKCPVFDECGGCQWQNMKYEKQLDYKQKLLNETLIKIGSFSESEIEQKSNKTIGMETPYHYRNKGNFKIDINNNEVLLGFYSQKSKNIIEFEKCYIQNESINEIYNEIKLFLKNKNPKEIEIQNIIIRASNLEKKILIGFCSNQKKFQIPNDLIFHLINKFPNIKGIIKNVTDKNNSNNILKKIILYGEDKVMEEIMGHKFKLSINSFFQINHSQTINLAKKIAEIIKPNGEEVILDAYSGTGTIGICLAKKVKKVIGIESFEPAVENSLSNAKLNKINNFENTLGKTEKVIEKILKEEKIDWVVLDPPRKGVKEQVLNLINEHYIDKIIYVSCNPVTLSRDLKILSNHSYEIVSVNSFDMFPQTHHLETIVFLRKKE